MSEPALQFTLNGVPVRRNDVPVDELLLDTLRWRLDARGTKEGCRTGDCGACTVLVGGRTALACLTLAHEIAGEKVVTIEGLEDDPVGRRVRAAFEKESALQCGYCTPGFVVALTGAIRSRPKSVEASTLLDDLGGNLCRCTGYRSIRRAVEALASESR